MSFVVNNPPTRAVAGHGPTRAVAGNGPGNGPDDGHGSGGGTIRFLSPETRLQAPQVP